MNASPALERLTPLNTPNSIELTPRMANTGSGPITFVRTISAGVPALTPRTHRQPIPAAEPQSSDTRHLLAAIIESSDDAIVSKGLDGIVTSWNQAAVRMFGYQAAEMIGQPVLRLIPPELHHEEDMILAKIRSGERIDHYETTRVKKSGERFEVSVTISPVKNAQGVIIGASKTARDISERKKMQRLLLQSEKFAATGRMAATVAHEINNPLESVMNLVYLARTAGELDQSRTYLQTAEKELERVAHIVRQTLGYYRDSAAPVEVNLREIVEDVLTIYQRKLTSSSIAVDCRFDTQRTILARKGELVQVLSNLVANSIDAMSSGGVLKLDIAEVQEPERQGVSIAIRDSGPGIPQEDVIRVFEPFFSTKGDLGTGIGLWVASQLIQKNSGDISIESSINPGSSGTTVSIFMPFTPPAAQAANLDPNTTQSYNAEARNAR